MIKKSLQWSDEMVAKFWANQNTTKENYFTFQVKELLVKKFNKHIQGSVLDYGCGLGFFLEELLKRRKDITAKGMEFTDDSILACNQRLGGKEQYQGTFNIEQLKSSGEQFDCITLFEVIEHLSDDYVDSVMTNIKALLKKNGKLIITTPNNENLDAGQVFCPNCEHSFHRMQHVQSWNIDSLGEVLIQHGFTPISIVEDNLGIEQVSQPYRLIKKTALILDRIGVLNAKKYNLIAVATI